MSKGILEPQVGVQSDAWLLLFATKTLTNTKLFYNFRLGDYVAYV